MSIQSKREIRAPTVGELIRDAQYPTLEHIVSQAFGTIVPPVRMSVPEAAKLHMKMGSGSGHTTPWDPKKTPYMVEPLETLTDLDHDGMVFIGPARTGKSVGALAWITHTVETDPEDMLMVQMDRENARKWSKGDLDRFLTASPKIRARQLTRQSEDNTFDKQFDSGMKVLITYPTGANLSNITVGKVWLFDYDRGDDLVDGEGTKYDLAQKRTQTKGRFGMTVAEASPNPHKEITDPKWAPSTPHEGPPIKGIFEIYNRGDRRRWYWCCPSCDEWFEPAFKLLDWGGHTDPMEASENTVMICPHNGCIIESRLKQVLNIKGRWVPDGGRIDENGDIVPLPGQKLARSTIASFWMKGPAAAYQPWSELVSKYLRAQKSLEDTGDDGPLRSTVTTDQGEFYISASRLSERSPEDLKNKAEDWGSTEEEPTVPAGVRFLTATADVQKTSFVCQVNGHMANGDIVIVDSFKFRLSNRMNSDGDRMPIEPFAYREDWDVLTDLLRRSYPLADASGRRMKVRAVACDSGGGEGAAANAYNYWRSLKTTEDGLHRRFILLKGEPSRTAPRARTTWPDSSQKDKHAIARGDVPVLLLNSNLLKDQLSSMLSRRTSEEDDSVDGRAGKLRYPDWMPEWFYKQMTTEIRTEKGWENPRKRRNEAFDLSYYAIGLVVRPVERGVPWVHFGFERIDWNAPPIWAADWDENEFVFDPNADKSEVKSNSDAKKSFADLAGKLA